MGDRTPTPQRPILIDASICTGLVILALLLRVPRLTAIYGWDEVDYVRAAGLGPRASYLGEGVLDANTFVQKGVIKALHLGDHLIETPPGYDENRDPLVLAHHHPPLLIYFIAAARAAMGRSEWVARLPALIFGLGNILLVYIGCVVLLGAQGRLVGSFAGLSLVLMPIHIEASRVLSTHTTASWFALCSLFSIVRFRQNGRRVHLYAAAVTAALIALTLEFAPTLVALAAIAVVGTSLLSIRRESIRVSWHIVGLFGTFGLTLFLGWPAGFLKLGWLEVVATRAYNLTVMTPEEPGWLVAFSRLHPAWAGLYALTVTWCALKARRVEAQSLTYPTLAFVAIVFLGVLGIPFVNFVRALALFVALSLIVGIALGSWWRTAWPVWLATLIALILMTTSAARSAVDAHKLGSGKRILSYLEAQDHLAPILADGGHIFRYYLPDHRVIEFPLFESADMLKNPERFSPVTSQRLRQYLDLRKQLAQGTYEYLILQNGRELWDPELAEIVRNSYRLMPAFSDSARLYRHVGR